MLQSERISDACEQLGLNAVPAVWPVVAKQVLDKEGSYADFVEQLLA